LNNQEGVLCTVPFIKALETKKTKKNIQFNILPKRIYKAQRKGFEVVGLNDEEQENYQKFMNTKQYIIENERYFYPSSELTLDRNIMFLSTVNRTGQPFSTNYQEILDQDEDNDDYNGLDDNYKQMLKEAGLETVLVKDLLTAVQSPLKQRRFQITSSISNSFIVKMTTRFSKSSTSLYVRGEEIGLGKSKDVQVLLPLIVQYLTLKNIKTGDNECNNIFRSHIARRSINGLYSNINEKITKIYYKDELISLDRLKEMSREKVPHPTKLHKDNKPVMINKYKIVVTNYIDSVNFSRFEPSLNFCCKEIILSD
jgi:hypothetical protein